MKQQYILVFLLFLTIQSTAQGSRHSLSADEMKQEVLIIKSAFVALHPGLYRFNTPAQIDNYFDEVMNTLSGKVTDREYYLLLSQLSTKIKCGHTYLNPWNQKGEIVKNYFSPSHIPFLYKVIDGKFIITHNLSEDASIKRGDEIERINGVPVKHIIDSLLTVSRSDGKNGFGKKIDNINIVPLDIDTANYSLFDIYFPLFFQENMDMKNYVFQIKPYRGRSKLFTLKSVTKKERQAIYVSRFGEIPVHEKNWEFKFLNTNTAYLRLGDFETWEWKADYKKYLDSVFTVAINAKADNLIVDIRGNEGGDDEARTEVLSYIADKPFGCENPMRRLYKFLTIPDSLLPYLKTWNKTFKEPKKEKDYLNFNGYYEKIDTASLPCEPTYPKSKNYKGNVFLLTNASNSSTTFTMADIFKNYSFGKIVGEPTGGTKQGLNGGQFFFLYLPYSKIEIDLPIIWGSPTINRPDEGVTPDYEIRTTQKDIHRGVDSQIEYILKNN